MSGTSCSVPVLDVTTKSPRLSTPVGARQTRGWTTAARLLALAVGPRTRRVPVSSPVHSWIALLPCRRTFPIHCAVSLRTLLYAERAELQRPQHSTSSVFPLACHDHVSEVPTSQERGHRRSPSRSCRGGDRTGCRTLASWAWPTVHLTTGVVWPSSSCEASWTSFLLHVFTAAGSSSTGRSRSRHRSNIAGRPGEGAGAVPDVPRRWGIVQHAAPSTCGPHRFPVAVGGGRTETTTAQASLRSQEVSSPGSPRTRTSKPCLKTPSLRPLHPRSQSELAPDSSSSVQRHEAEDGCQSGISQVCRRK